MLCCIVLRWFELRCVVSVLTSIALVLCCVRVVLRCAVMCCAELCCAMFVLCFVVFTLRCVRVVLLLLCYDVLCCFRAV